MPALFLKKTAVMCLEADLDGDDLFSVGVMCSSLKRFAVMRVWRRVFHDGACVSVCVCAGVLIPLLFRLLLMI